MDEAVEAARRFNEVWGPAALWAMDNWPVFLAGFFFLALAVGLMQQAQKISDREALAKAIAKATREGKTQ
jgi:hypothetical protein